METALSHQKILSYYNFFLFRYHGSISKAQ